jgi:SAM-dependent MidA family methyltransferase
MTGPRNKQLIEFIQTKIRRSGPVSFAWFMEQALYHPEFGYYSSGKARLGRQGDYFTNVSVGPVFGELLAAQVVEVWDTLGRPERFTIVEQGADDGQLAQDILTSSAAQFAECFERLRYLIVEPFPVLRRRQEQSLTQFAAKVIWSPSLEAVEPWVGLHFSNELLDAFPVRLICRHRGSHNDPEWFERCVDCKGDEFTFVEQPIADAALRQPLERMTDLPDGFQIELNRAALDWVDVLSAKLQRGWVLMIDYGYLQHDLTETSHRDGTLQCRANHQLIDSPLNGVGECDITAHVNWTAIADRAQEKKFRIAGFTDQHHFLTGIISEHPELASDSDPGNRRQLQTLLHPEMMGRSFQVLALSRGIDPAARLSGFKFARSPAQLFE